MRYDPNIHHHRSIRLRDYDYSRAGYYFVTICTFEREVTLDRTDVAEVVTDVWTALLDRFSNVELDEFVVMPNHIHGIVTLRETGETKLSQVIRAFKSISAIQANRLLGRAQRPFWQRNYYERVIRSESELLAVRQYIRNNPPEWDGDPENPTVAGRAGRG